MNNVEDDSVNPYAPPISVPAVQKEDDEFPSRLKVELVGRPKQKDLRACLVAEQRINVVGLAVAFVSLITPMVVIVVERFPLGLLVMSVGVCGLLMVAYVVSAVRYRAGVFRNAFPQWDAADGGRIDSDGIALFEGESWVLYRWGWFSHAIVADHAISFVPNLRSKCPVLIGQDMLVTEVSGNALDEWETFIKLSVDLLERSRTTFYRNRQAIDPTQVRSNVELMCNRERLRTVVVDVGAVSFSGDVTTRDLERIATVSAVLRRTLRSRMVIGLLTLFGGLLVGGISELWLNEFAILLVFYLMVILAWNIKARTSRVLATQRRHFFLLGYVTDQRVVLDLDITVASFAWREMQLLVATDDLIAIKSGRRGQPIVLRPDMFQTAEQWNDVFETAMQHATPASV